MLKRKNKRWKKKQFWSIGIFNMWRIWRRRKNKHVLMTKKVSSYVETLASQSLNSGLKAMFTDSQSHHNSAMQIDISEAEFMRFLVKTIQARYVLEIGTFRGWSAAVLATAIAEVASAASDSEKQDWKLTTIELRKEQADQAKLFWSEYMPPEIISHVDLIQGDAKSIMKDTHQMQKMCPQSTLDLVFIDGDKAGYQVYTEVVTPYMKKGGLIVLDNMLNAGLVATASSDRTSQSIRDLNATLFDTQSTLASHFEVTMIPAWDGVVILRKK